MIQCKSPYSRYMISEDGQTIHDTLKNKQPYEHTVPEGYVFVALVNDETGITQQVRKHRLIAINLIPIPEKLKNVPVNKLEINHIDENPRNNSINNIEWCTYSENKQRGRYMKSSTRNLWKHRTVYQYD